MNVLKNDHPHRKSIAEDGKRGLHLGAKKSSLKKSKKRSSKAYNMKTIEMEEETSGSMELAPAAPTSPTPSKRRPTTRRRRTRSLAPNNHLAAKLERDNDSSRRESARSVSPHAMRSRCSLRSFGSTHSFDSAPPIIVSTAIENAIESLRSERKKLQKHDSGMSNFSFTDDEWDCTQIKINSRLSPRQSPTSVTASIYANYTSSPELLHVDIHGDVVSEDNEKPHNNNVSFCEDKNEKFNSPWNQTSDHRKTCWIDGDELERNLWLAKVRKKVKKKLLKNLPVKKGYFEDESDNEESSSKDSKPSKKKQQLRLTKKGKKIVEQLIDTIMEQPMKEIQSFCLSRISVTFCKKKRTLRVEKYL